MADTIVRLKVENSEYDAKINRARQGLLHMEEAAQKTGRSLTVLDKNEKAFVQSLGKMETVSKDARGRVNELTKAFTDLSVQYNRLSEEEKKGDFGKALKQSLEQIKQRAIEAKKELNDISGQLGNVQTPNLGGGLDFGGMAGGLTKLAGTFGLAVGGATLLKDALENNVQTAMQFEKAMSTLSSLTGMTGEDLDTLKQKAIEMGSNTTQSASQAAEAMAMIGSKRPDLLESAYALSDVTQAAITMSEAAGMEVPEAAESLAAALNIFQMESSEANRVINVLAAGSKLGAAGIKELGDITFRAGGSAQKAGLSFEEFAGAAEIIRPAFGTAEDAGQAFNKFLQMLESKMDSQYKPSVVGFEQAMKNLKDANLGSTESMKLFTINGVKAYDAIMANVDGLGKMIEGVTGTNTATEQAAINTNNLQGSMSSLSSAWEGFNLALNDSNGALKTMVDWLTDAVTWATNTFTELGRIKAKMDEINGAKGSGKPTRVDNNTQYVKNAQGSTTEEKKADAEKRKAVVNRNLDAQIKPLEEFVKAYREADGKKLAALRKTYKQIGDRSYNDIKAEAEALKQVRGEFNARADEFIKNIGKKPETTTTTTTTSTDGSSATKDKKTEEQLNTEKIRKLTEEYRSATDDRKTAIQEEIRALQVRNDEIKRLNDEAMGTLKPLRKDEQATYTITVDKSQLDDLKKELPEDATIVETVKVDAPGKVEIPVNVEQPEPAKVDAPGKVEIPVNVEQPEPVKVDAPDKVEITITAETSTADKSINDILRKYDGVKRVVENKPMQMQVGVSGLTSEAFAEYGKMLQESIKSVDLTSPLYENLQQNLADTTTLKNLLQTAIQNGIDTGEWNAENLWEQIINGDNIPDETWKKLVAEINAKLKDNPITLDFKTGSIKTESKPNGKKEDKSETELAQKAVSGINNIVSGIEQIGIEVPDEIRQGLSILQGISTIVSGISAMVAVIQALQGAKSVPIIGQFLANGGLPRAANGFVGGNTFSNDQIPIMVNSGELILNRAQQGNVASQLQGGSHLNAMHLETEVGYDSLRIVMNNGARKRRKGTYITSR